MSQAYDIIAVTGPTASGKTAFAANLAYRVDGEIISADSRQVYRSMNIGTGKDYNDYVVNGIRIPCHLTDIADPGYKYSIFEYQRDFKMAYDEIRQRNKIPILCGGSGMYLSAATMRYRLEEVPVNIILRKELENKSIDELAEILMHMKPLHNTTDTDTVEHALRAIEIEKYKLEHPVKTEMPPLNTIFIGIVFDRSEERERITLRLNQRLENGMIEEVRDLLSSGIQPESLSYYGLEYRYITEYLTGRINYDSMKAQLNIAIHQFAKRQRTWFRKMEKEGIKIHWIEGKLTMDQKIEKALALLHQRPLM
jgi:tRNA dimethylallyltransferase